MAARGACAAGRATARIGVLMHRRDNGIRAPFAAFRQACSELGYVDGRNLRDGVPLGARHRRPTSGAGAPSWLPRIPMSSSPPVGTEPLAPGHTATLPIVFAVGPIPSQLARRQPARPGGNVTGHQPFDMGLGGKWLELLRDCAARNARRCPRDPARSMRSANSGASIGRPLREESAQCA